MCWGFSAEVICPICSEPVELGIVIGGQCLHECCYVELLEELDEDD
jgi:hypothetical protein